MSELTTRTRTRTWTGRDSGHAAGGLAGLHLWLTVDGYALSTSVADGQKLVLASTGPDPGAAGAPRGARYEAPGTAGLARSRPTRVRPAR